MPVPNENLILRHLKLEWVATAAPPFGDAWEYGSAGRSSNQLARTNTHLQMSHEHSPSSGEEKLWAGPSRAEGPAENVRGLVKIT